MHQHEGDTQMANFKFKTKYRKSREYGTLFRYMVVSVEREDGVCEPDLEFHGVDMKWECSKPGVKVDNSMLEALWNGEEAIVPLMEKR